MDNSSEFHKLKMLVQEHKITIGVQRNHANNFWYHTTVPGKMFNLLMYLFIVLAVIIFVKFGIWFGILATVFLVVYVKAINYISGMHVRLKLFKNEHLFNVAYEAQSITLKDNKTGNIVAFPDKWNVFVKDYNWGKNSLIEIRKELTS